MYVNLKKSITNFKLLTKIQTIKNLKLHQNYKCEPYYPRVFYFKMHFAKVCRNIYFIRFFFLFYIFQTFEFTFTQ